MNVSFRYLKSESDPAFAELLRIYHAAFSRESREPDERLVAEIRGEYRLPFRFLVAEASSRTIGFARFCLLPEGDFGFLIHIAVDERSRGAGAGTDLVRQVLREMAPRPVIVEIDRSGRVRDWYHRHGFILLTDSYMQPPLHPDTEAVPFALCASEPVPDRVEAVEGFYRQAWELDRRDPMVMGALAGVAG